MESVAFSLDFGALRRGPLTLYRPAKKCMRATRPDNPKPKRDRRQGQNRKRSQEVGGLVLSGLAVLGLRI